MKVRNPYTANRQMAKLFDAMIDAARDTRSELYLLTRKGDLVRHTGGSHRCAFWAGVDVERGALKMKPLWVVPGTLGSACYRAGREAVRADILPLIGDTEKVA
jgi:hypothetical protein